MTDLDFDELDRAVNSLIGDTDQSVVEKPSPEIDTQAANVSVDSEVSADAQLNPQLAQQDAVEETPATPPVLEPSEDLSLTVPEEPQVTPQPLAARRSSGRFMDVVHPSSDMRTPNKVAARPMDASNISTPPIVEPTQAVSEPEVTADRPQEPSVNEDIAIPDVSEDKESAVVSPFLSDAKVEKRPLGAFADNGKPAQALNDLMQKELETSENTNDDIKLVENDENSAKDSEITMQPKVENTDEMPEELQGDVLSIETKESEAVVVPDDIETKPTPSINAPVAITQQYVEKAQTAEVESGAIFDTDAYHQPVVTGKAHHSGWMTVLWIFLLIILGAGAGVAIYTYVLPLL